MNINNASKRAIRNYVIIDYITAFVGWVIFWVYRKQWLYNANPDWEKGITLWEFRDYFIGFFLVPIIWIFIHYLTGAYADPYRKSRIHEVYRTLLASLIGCMTLGLTAIANDWTTFSYFIQVTSLFFITQASITSLVRTIYLSSLKRKLQKPQFGYNAILVGGNGKLAKAYEELVNGGTIDLYQVIGYISINDEMTNIPLKKLGNLDELTEIIDQYDIQEVFVALESSEHDQLEKILVSLSYKKLFIKVLPDTYDIISGSVKTTNVFDPIFLTIRPQLISDWQRAVKRTLDFVVSLFGIIMLVPVYIICVLMVKITSTGPIFYFQERIGLFGKPFNIIKFRSMYVDAEKHGPALSKTADPRITSWGRIMRKWRLDELPQFFNILRGDMSLVGPRPERKFFIDQIIITHPHYKYLHRVKRGLTSWGMVKYGYAETVQQMIQRMKFDLLYIENCSILLDIKIMIYTVKVLAQGRGK